MESLRFLLSASNATLSSESYSYLGLGRVVEKTTPVATLSYIQATGDTAANTDAGDKYTGLDRFGRVIDQVWRNSSGSVIDRYQYGYDRSGNRMSKNNLVDSALSELYGYDNLNQLTSFSRGVLSDANSDGIFDTVSSPSRTQAWNLDAMGNWSTLTTNSTSQSRTHNAQNQVTGVGSASLTFDANGSMSADEAGRTFIYDAWNRLAAVRNTANSPIVGYSYDALGRRIIEDRPNANTVDQLYYSTSWQVLEERRDGTSTGDVRRQYFWGIDYVDALTARVDYASGAVSATYHAQYDANWNITAIADATSGVLERYIYDPYGTATVLYANWTVRGGSPYGWNYLHQGGRFDVDSNLHNFRHRDYSATLGRWTQTDPIGFEAGDVNFYRYVGNSPGNGVDPLGLRDFGMTPRHDRPTDKPQPPVPNGPVPNGGFGESIRDSWISIGDGILKTGISAGEELGLDFSEYLIPPDWDTIYRKGPLGQTNTPETPDWVYYGTRGAIGASCLSTGLAVGIGTFGTFVGGEGAIGLVRLHGKFRITFIYGAGEKSSLLKRSDLIWRHIGNGEPGNMIREAVMPRTVGKAWKLRGIPLRNWEYPVQIPWDPKFQNCLKGALKSLGSGVFKPSGPFIP